MKPYFSPAGFRYFAHRGLCVCADGQVLDENTAAAFERALAVGANYLEIDVRASKDGVAFVCHDADLVRIAAQPDKIADLTAEQLAQVKLNRGGTLLRLSELLARFPHARVNIDIKSADAVHATVSAIKLADAQDRVLISSFSERRRRAAIAQLPQVATSSSALLLIAIWLSWRLKLKKSLRAILSKLAALQIPVASGWMRFDSPEFIEAVSKHGTEVHFWTINDPIVARELRARGASGVVSDRIDLIIAEFAE